MKIKLLLICLCFGGFIAKAQMPYIATPTILPQNPGPNSIIKVVSKVITANQSIVVDQNSVSITGQQIKIRGCYWQGFATATQTFIDTLVVGQLPAGSYQILQKAYLATTQQHCSNPVDSNNVSLSFTVSAVTGITQQVTNPEMSVYPNPSTNWLFIYGVPDEAEVFVFSATGAFVEKTLLVGQKLNICNLPEGLYFVRITDKNQSFATKFIKSGLEQH